MLAALSPESLRPEALEAISRATALAAHGRQAAGARLLMGLGEAGLHDPVVREQLGLALFHAGRFQEGASLIRESGAQDLGSLSCRAACLVALGDLAGAEAAFDRMIALYPNDGAAWYNRATVRRWKPGDNHVIALRRAIGRADPTAEIAVRYGLAKELEDLGQDEESFEHLARGADLRRRRLSYRVEADVEVMGLIAQAFSAEALAAAEPADVSRPGPIFVLGLPRSGTTLVDRILSSHSQVTSLGEIPDFAMALMDTTPRATDRAGFVAAAAAADHSVLARRFTDRLAGYERDSVFLIDKTPVNFLYIGLIALALPQARIIHVGRDPMDVGYALYKTLFQTGCPYSYDQTDIGRYMGAANRLMAHWRQALPGRIIDVAYEDLIDNLETESRRLAVSCGLAWEDQMVDFHLNAAPSSTASAAQVRRPLYRDSLGLWRRFADQLTPLKSALLREGVL